MKASRFTFALLTALAVAACSEKRKTAEREAENEQQPHEDKIAEDCVGFVRATKVVAAQSASGDCPACASPGTEVLRFQQMKTDRISCANDTCDVTVTIGAVFNAGAGEIGGGLTAWIPPEQRAEYLRGNAPKEEQTYRVKIIYKRASESWRAVEFDNAETP